MVLWLFRPPACVHSHKVPLRRALVAPALPLTASAASLLPGSQGCCFPAVLAREYSRTCSWQLWALLTPTLSPCVLAFVGALWAGGTGASAGVCAAASLGQCQSLPGGTTVILGAPEGRARGLEPSVPGMRVAASAGGLAGTEPPGLSGPLARGIPPQP